MCHSSFTSILGEGNNVYLRAGASYGVQNDGTEDASFLRLSLSTTLAPASASPVASPGATTVNGDLVTTLAEFPLTGIPAAPANLALSRATWAPGADSGPYTQSGPMALLVESGTLTVTSPSGLDGQLGEGNAVLLPQDQPLRTRNDGSSDAVALMFGLVPVNQNLIQAVPPTPTPEPTPEPAPEPTATAVPSPTPEPTPTAEPTPIPEPTAEPTPIPSLYHITAEEGFESWGGSGDWKTVNGMLVNDGTNETRGAYIAAPYQPTTANYAIEAEIQFARGGNNNSFGVVARASDGSAYWVGILTGRTSYIWAGDEPRGRGIAEANYDPAGEWHTLRVEVRGNEIRFLIDGTVILETTDNRYLAPGRVGLWSYRSQVSVRSFTVYSLDEGGASASPQSIASSGESPAIVSRDSHVSRGRAVPGVHRQRPDRAEWLNVALQQRNTRQRRRRRRR